MFLRFLLSLVAAIVLSGCETSSPPSHKGFRPGAYANIRGISAFSERADYHALHQVIKSADYQFELDHEVKLIARLPNHPSSFEKYRHVSFPLNPNSSTKKEFAGFVVVQLHKLAQIDDVEQRVQRVNDFFFSRGASRVLVTGFRGNGRSIYSDLEKT